MPPEPSAAPGRHRVDLDPAAGRGHRGDAAGLASGVRRRLRSGCPLERLQGSLCFSGMRGPVGVIGTSPYCARDMAASVACTRRRAAGVCAHGGSLSAGHERRQLGSSLQVGLEQVRSGRSPACTWRSAPQVAATAARRPSEPQREEHRQRAGERDATPMTSVGQKPLRRIWRRLSLSASRTPTSRRTGAGHVGPVDLDVDEGRQPTGIRDQEAEGPEEHAARTTAAPSTRRPRQSAAMKKARYLTILEDDHATDAVKPEKMSPNSGLCPEVANCRYMLISPATSG